LKVNILVIEREAASRHRLCARLLSLEYAVKESDCVLQALEYIKAFRPDMVLVEAVAVDEDPMAIRRLREECGLPHLPVLMTHATPGQDMLVRFVQSQASDFIDDTQNDALLSAKLIGLSRMKSLYDELLRQQSRLSQEVRQARRLFDRVKARNAKSLRDLQYWSLSAGHFSGDVLLFEKSPDGSLYVLLGDFTGHGLCAAIGSLPAADVFHAMTAKGCSLAEIASELNRKLHVLLPTGHFFAATLLQLCPEKACLRIWNGGQPPVIFLNRQGRIVGRIPSSHYPIGVLGPARFNPHPEQHALKGVAYVFACSDGVLEARSASGDFFGEERLTEALHRLSLARQDPLSAIKHHLLRFMAGMEPADDISLLTLELEKHA
jgi:two-component system, HptB-dependent secretion and biofilm response regulator